ncbi:hypothetical protein H0H93_001059 [Arthromyces matolae]|nr:hypothetical protein H0H93_001059 [Arthromyces matolae]
MRTLMWLAHICLYLVLLIPSALSAAIASPTRSQSNSGPPERALPPDIVPPENLTKIQDDAPLYLERLISKGKVHTTLSDGDLGYKYRWNPSASGQYVVVYLIDTGVDTKNEEFRGRASDGWSYDGTFQDESGHGTLCASMIGGHQFGVAKNVKLVSVVVGRRRPTENGVQKRIAGLDYVLGQCKSKKHPCVASISLLAKPDANGSTENSDIDNKVKEVGAGNQPTEQRQSPAGVVGAITVGSHDGYDRKSTFSSYGKHLDMWAMGEGIVGLFTHDLRRILEREMWIQGLKGSVKARVNFVSQAAPIAAGIVALMISRHGNKSPQEIKEMVIEMGIKDEVDLPADKTKVYYGPNIMAHISEEIYNAA